MSQLLAAGREAETQTRRWQRASAFRRRARCIGSDGGGWRASADRPADRASKADSGRARQSTQTRPPPAATAAAADRPTARKSAATQLIPVRTRPSTCLRRACVPFPFALLACEERRPPRFSPADSLTVVVPTHTTPHLCPIRSSPPLPPPPSLPRPKAARRVRSHTHTYADQVICRAVAGRRRLSRPTHKQVPTAN